MRVRFILFCWCIVFLAVSGNHCHPAGTSSRRILASRDGPFAKELSKSSHARSAVRELLKLIRDEVARKMEEMRAYSYSTNQQELCNLRPSKDVVDGLYGTFESLGLGKLYSPCTTDSHLEALGAWHAALEDYISEVTRAAGSLLQRIRGSLPKEECFMKAHPYFEFKYRDRMQSCTLQHVSAIYARNRWSLTAQLTNAPPASMPEEWHRLYLSENVYQTDSDSLESMPMNLTGGPGTTSLSFWGGSPATTRFSGSLSAAENPAVREALRIADAREQAESLTFGSNVAILIAIPLITSLVPLSAFADSSTVISVLYMLLTDCFAMLPAVIKSIELLGFAAYHPKSMILRLYEPNGGLGAAELWYAQCDTSNELYKQGVVLLVCALVLEVVARRKLKGSKRHYLEARRYMEKHFIRSLEDVCKANHLDEDVSRRHLFSGSRLGLVGEVDGYCEYNSWARKSGVLEGRK